MAPRLIYDSPAGGYVHVESAYTAERMPQRKFSNVGSGQASSHINKAGASYVADMATPPSFVGHYHTDIVPTNASEAPVHAGIVDAAQNAQRDLVLSVTGAALSGLGQQTGAEQAPVIHQWTPAMLASLEHATKETENGRFNTWEAYTPSADGPRFPLPVKIQAAQHTITGSWYATSTTGQDHDSSHDTLGTGEMFDISAYATGYDTQLQIDHMSEWSFISHSHSS